MHRNPEQIKRNLNKLCDDLIEIAMEDSVLSDDENAIINEIKKDLENLNRQIMQILEGDLDDEEFKDLCLQILEDVLADAKLVANRDQIITGDEQKLLDRMKEFLENEELFK